MRFSYLAALALVAGLGARAEAGEADQRLWAALQQERATPSQSVSRERLSMLSANGETTFERSDPLTRAFIAGAVKGIVYSNTIMRRAKKPVRFCLPNGALSIDELWDLAEEVLSGAQKQDTIVITGLFQLEKKYPCQQLSTEAD